jgi:DNA-binding response OmpR family regulator
MSDAERIAELEAENAWLRGELGAARDADKHETLCKVFGTRHGTSLRLIVALHAAKGRAMTHGQLEDVIGPDREAEYHEDMVKVVVCNARKAIGRDAIRTLWGAGYAMTPAGMAKVDAALGIADRMAA